MPHTPDGGQQMPLPAGARTARENHLPGREIEKARPRLTKAFLGVEGELNHTLEQAFRRESGEIAVHRLLLANAGFIGGSFFAFMALWE
jgi:hypothetical protein